VKKYLRVTKKQNNAIAKILLNEINQRGMIVHENTLYGEMIDDFIYRYYAENDDVTKEHGTMRGYIYRATLNNEEIDVSQTAKMFHSSKSSVSVTRSRIRKQILENSNSLRE